MGMSIKQRVASGALALALLGGTGASVAAQNQGNTGNQGGAAGLIAAVVQANLTNVRVITVDDSFNNLTVTALNNILNNSPILNDLSITVKNVSVLNGVTIFLLSNGDFVVLP
jgi:hypothetical protein